MGINFNNNKNNQFSLNTSKLNQSKALNNSNKIANAKAANAANSANTLNSATLKSNQGLKLDSNNFGKTDVIPANDNPPVAKAEGEKSGGSEKKSWWERFKEGFKKVEDEKKEFTQNANGLPYGAGSMGAAGVLGEAVINGIIYASTGNSSFTSN